MITMKKNLTLPLVRFLANAVQPHTIGEARKHIYYLRFETVKNILQAVIDKGTALPDAWYWRGEVYFQQNKIDPAQKSWWGRSLFPEK